MGEKIKCSYKGCKKEFEQAPLKKPKKFCSDNCRQKDFRDKQTRSYDELKLEHDKLLKERNALLTEIKVQDLTRPTSVIKPVGEPPAKTNFTINTNVPSCPKREDFKDGFDFSAAKAEWKRIYNQK